jgi:drug/metabolite transporter (DMT)-like permease
VKIERSHLLFGLMCLIWGATWIAVKVGISAVPPSLFAGTRFIIAGALLLLYWRLRGEALGISRSDLPRLIAVTLLMVVATYSLLFWGARFVSSGLTAILDLAFMPVALLSIGAILGEERFTRARAFGVAVGICGLFILFGPKAFSSNAEASSLELLGGSAIVLSALVYSLGSVLARPLLRTYPSFLLSGLMLLGGGLTLFAGSMALEPGAAQALSGRWGTPAWAAWIFLVVFGSLLAYTIFLQLIHEWGASRAGAYAFVSPVIAVLLGVLVFGEVVTVVDAIGMTTTLAGAWLTLRPAPTSDPDRIDLEPRTKFV